jgi:type VI protein secretion system component VasF
VERFPLERLARLEEKLSGVVDDLGELRQIRKDDHHRLRSVEASVSMMLEQQRDARKAEQRQYDRLVLWLQVAAVLVALLVGVAGVVAAVLASS